MRISLAAFALTLTAAAALAQTPTISPQQAKDHIGQVVTVEGAVSDVHHAASGRATFIDIGGRHPDNQFTGIIFGGDARKFPDVDSFNGKTVDITGRVKLYKGTPEIILNDRAQIKVK